MSNEPRTGRALYVTVPTVRRTDDNALVVESPGIDRLVVCEVGGYIGTREQAVAEEEKWLLENYPRARGYSRHHVRVYEVPDRVIREAFAALESKESK